MKYGKDTGPLEGFNSFLLDYCPKKRDFQQTHQTRIYSAINDWN